MFHPLRTLTARWLFPADRPPVPRGTITIAGDTIVAIEAAGATTAQEDLGNVAILPGLVNAHTHLDLSDAHGESPPNPDFTAWLRGVIRHRRGQTTEQVTEAIAKGLAQSQRHGVLLVGDIAVQGRSWSPMSQAALRARVFHELIGLSSESAQRSWQEMLRWRAGLAESPNCRMGLSPHAPFSVNSSLFTSAARDACVTAIHLAETADELELLEHRSGAFVTFLKDLGVWHPEGLSPSLDWILQSNHQASSVLFVHCNFLPGDAPFPSNATVVYCPRTHEAFGHPRHPFRAFLKRGVRVVLGTDSLASNPDLDILSEARFVHAQHPDLPGETLLRMITLDSAVSLGWGEMVGSLTPGKSADLVILPLPDRREADPHRLLFESTSTVERVMFRGKWQAAAGPRVGPP